MKKITIFTFILSAIPLLVYLVLFSKLPDELPMQFSFDGTINRYGSKLEFSLLPILTFAMFFMFKFLPKIDPKKNNYEKFGKSYNIIHILLILFMNATFFFTLYIAVTPATIVDGGTSLIKLIPASVGILFIVIGNYMPKFKPNYFCGIKTAWTLASDVVWAKTHRLGGRCFIFAGILIVVSAFLSGGVIATVTFAATLVAAGIPVVMSYVYFKQEEARKTDKIDK